MFNRRRFLRYLPLSLLGLVVPSTLLGSGKDFPTDKEIAKHIGKKGYIGVNKKGYEEMKELVGNLVDNSGAVRYVNKDVVFWFDDSGKIVDKEVVAVTTDDKDIYLPTGYRNYIPKINPICKHIRERKSAI